MLPDPDTTASWCPPSRYLSGDVRSKLDTARTAAASDATYTRERRPRSPRWSRSTSGPGTSRSNPGSPGSTPQDYTLFLREVLEAPDRDRGVVGPRRPVGHHTSRPFEKFSHPIQHTYGTGTKDAVDLLESLLNNRPIASPRRSPTSTAPNGRSPTRRPPRPPWTNAPHWPRRSPPGCGVTTTGPPGCWTCTTGGSTPTCPPAYDGTHLHLPGLGEHFSPRRTQRDAVARVLAEDTLLDHVVGAGKSGTMFMAAMEMRRRGLARQPWIVVPNHLVAQVAREAKQWYPAARVLAGPSATTAVSRREFTALTAVADFDLVIVPETLFTAIPVSARTRSGTSTTSSTPSPPPNANAAPPVARQPR